MPVHVFGPITVVGRPIRTFIEIRRRDLVEIRASGTVDLGGAVLGIGAPVLGPDGDNWVTPRDYPAPELRKNSLIVGVRSATYPFGTIWHQGGTNRSFSSPVDGFLTLAANDGFPDDNTRGWSVSLTITTPERFGSSSVRLGIGRVEFVQSMQRTDNSVPLVAGKRTLVRVFVNSGRPDRAPVPVTGTLDVRQADGSSLSLMPSTPGSAVPEGTQDRNDIASSLNFILPGSPAGTSRVRVQVHVPGRATDAGYFAEMRTEATFVLAPMIVIRPLLIALPALGLGPPNLVAATMVLNDAVQRLPLADGRGILPFDTFVYPLGFGDRISWRNLLLNVATHIRRPEIGEPGQRHYLHFAFVQEAPGFELAGIGSASTWTRAAACSIRADLDLTADTCAHEIGHALGLSHAFCTRPTLCGDPPGPHSVHLPALCEEPGWSANDNEMIPAGSPEMMVYSGSRGGPVRRRWPSTVAYRYVLNDHYD